MNETEKKQSEENKKIWETMSQLLFLVDSLTKDVKELRIDVDKLIENNQGGRYSKYA